MYPDAHHFVKKKKARTYWEKFVSYIQRWVHITNLYYSNERAQDAVGAAVEAGNQTGITVSYNDTGNALNFNVDKKIIGGVVVKVGSKMIDTSLANKINKLKIAMKGV